MRIEKVHNNIRYTLTNDGLKCGDKVYPIASGRCLDDGSWILHDFCFEDYCSGFPNEPHIIKELKYSKSKPYEVRTNHGYSPKECYYKIVKREKQIVDPTFGSQMFVSWIWVEIKDDDEI